MICPQLPLIFSEATLYYRLIRSQSQVLLKVVVSQNQMKNHCSWRLIFFSRTSRNSLYWERRWFQLNALALFERLYKTVNVALWNFNRIPKPVLGYFDSFPFVYVLKFRTEAFIIIDTEPSKMQREQWIWTASSRHKLCFADPLGRGNYSFDVQHYKHMMPEPL